MNEVSKIKDNDLIIDAVAILLGDYEDERKKAAVLILKNCLEADFFKFLMEDDQSRRLECSQ